MDYLILVNKENKLDKSYVPDDLVLTDSKYKDNIMIRKEVYDNFKKMQKDMSRLGYYIDIMSGYRDYNYQEKIYNKLVNEKGLNYAFRYIAKEGYSEHQTGLAIDICVYKDDKCYIEKELEDFDEIKWIIDNCYRYGFIIRYPYDKEDITGYNYEPWHLRYVSDKAFFIWKNNITLEEYLEKTCN